MSKLGVSAPMIEKILTRAPVILKGGMDLGTARRYTEAVRKAGARVSLEEDAASEIPESKGAHAVIEPLEHFTLCPQCGYKQLKSETCERCGFHLEP